MKISWKKIDEYAQSVYVGGFYIGEVRADFLTLKWSMYPDFWDDNTRQELFYKKFHSSYECGKAMAEVYENMFNRKADPWERLDTDTQEIDMSGIFGGFKP